MTRIGSALGSLSVLPLTRHFIYEVHAQCGWRLAGARTRARGRWSGWSCLRWATSQKDRGKGEGTADEDKHRPRRNSGHRMPPEKQEGASYHQDGIRSEKQWHQPGCGGGRWVWAIFLLLTSPQQQLHSRRGIGDGTRFGDGRGPAIEQASKTPTECRLRHSGCGGLGPDGLGATRNSSQLFTGNSPLVPRWKLGERWMRVRGRINPRDQQCCGSRPISRGS